MILKKVNWKRLAILVKKWLQKNIFHIILFGVITAIFILVVWEIASKQKMCNYEEEKQSVVESSVVTTTTSLNDNVTNSSTTNRTDQQLQLLQKLLRLLLNLRLHTISILTYLYQQICKTICIKCQMNMMYQLN